MIGLKYILLSSTLLALPSLTAAKGNDIAVPSRFLGTYGPPPPLLYPTMVQPRVAKPTAVKKPARRGGKTKVRKQAKKGVKSKAKKQMKGRMKERIKMRIKLTQKIKKNMKARAKKRKAEKGEKGKNNGGGNPVYTVVDKKVKKTPSKTDTYTAADPPALPLVNEETTEDAHLKAGSNSGSRPAFSIFCVLALGVDTIFVDTNIHLIYVFDYINLNPCPIIVFSPTVYNNTL